MEKNQDSFGLTSEFRRTERTKFCSAVWVRCLRRGFRVPKNRKKTKICLRVLKNGKEPRFISSGGLPIFGKSGTKIRKIGTEKNQDSIGWIFKFRSMEKNQDSFQVEFRRSEEKEPRFVSSGGLSSSGERKKIKIRRFGWISDEWMN
ncbi:uncharacterized protein OCT59_026297 [Rhizophagus irregularis]|uniref:uncharacterized protein n=1 Tax=Rhizophagus irregularis TaxID=588596 RepID=UPI00332A2473|nr:hypothetical protein OCT59_026297 [Rhizophagus irregularis]